MLGCYLKNHKIFKIGRGWALAQVWVLVRDNTVVPKFLTGREKSTTVFAPIYGMAKNDYISDRSTSIRMC